MPNPAQHSSSAGFIFFKHGRFASRSYPSQPQRESLPERPVSSGLPPQPVAGSKGGQRPLRGVPQDKGLLTQALKGTTQPGLSAHQESPAVSGRNGDRSQSRTLPPVKLVHSTFWIDPRVRAEMERQAAEEGITFSEIGARACAAWVKATIQEQQEQLFEPRLRHMMRQEIQALGERLVFFEMRNAFSSEQTRIVATDLYKRQLQKDGVSREKFYELMDKTDEMARDNITKKSPKFKGILAEWEAVYTAKGQEATVN